MMSLTLLPTALLLLQSRLSTRWHWCGDNGRLNARISARSAPHYQRGNKKKISVPTKQPNNNTTPTVLSIDSTIVVSILHIPITKMKFELTITTCVAEGTLRAITASIRPVFSRVSVYCSSLSLSHSVCVCMFTSVSVNLRVCVCVWGYPVSASSLCMTPSLLR